MTGRVGTSAFVKFVFTAVVTNLIILPQKVTSEDYELKGPKYPLHTFAFLDTLDVPQAFNNRHYIKFLLKCVFFEGHCDLVGKWLKPRTMAALFGKCLACTEHQQLHLDEWLGILVDKNPLEFRAAMVKVCVDMDLPVDQKDIKLIQPFLKNRL